MRRFFLKMERRFVLSMTKSVPPAVLTRSQLQGTDARFVLPQENFGNRVQRRVSKLIKPG